MPVKVCIYIAGREQRLVSAALYNVSVFERYDLVGTSDRRQTMGNYERCSSPHQRFKGFEYLSFSMGIERRCRLVKDEDGSVFQQCPGDTDALPFSPRKLRAAFAYYSVITLR